MAYYSIYRNSVCMMDREFAQLFFLRVVLCAANGVPIPKANRKIYA
jgi:hypothetical protein